MLFQFLKYTNPINYFNLKRLNGTTIFPNWNDLPKEVQQKISLDTNYSTKAISELDAAWQAVKKGYIGTTTTIQFKSEIPIADEYRFIRKYFHKFWVYYCCFIRIVSFKNPFVELHGVYKTRHVQRMQLSNNPIVEEHYANFHSILVASQPKVSVIIPTLNRYAYLIDVLHDLELQNYTNLEVIVIDQSTPFQQEFYNDFKLDLKVVHQEEKALWLARNTAVKIASSNYLLLFDDDSRVQPNWVEEHLKCMDFYKAQVSSGVSISVVGAKVPESYQYFKVSDQIDTGNVLILREVFEKIGLFDRQFEKQRMGDGEFGLRVYLAGFLNVSNPLAKRIHLKVASGGLREMGSWDGMRPVNWLSPRPIPSVIYFFMSYYGKKLTRLALLKSVPPSIIPYRFKGNSILVFLGYLLALLIFPLILIQVCKSWKLATKMLKEGAKIENI